VNGSGSNRAVFINSAAPENVVSNITIKNSTFNAQTNRTSVGAIEVNAPGGNINTVTFENVTIENVQKTAVTTFGNVTNFTFDNGKIAAPAMAGRASVVIWDSNKANITNSTIGANMGDAVQIGPNDDTGARHAATATTVSGNTFLGIGDNYAAVRMYNLNQGTVTQNTMTSKPGAVRSMGLVFAEAGSAGPGTTSSAATDNNLTGIAGEPTLVFAPNQGNTAIGNKGAPNYN
jgi:hypothetical protein